MEAAKAIAECRKLLREVLDPEEVAKYSQFKEEERQKSKQVADTAQPAGGQMDEPKGKPNPLVQRKKRGRTGCNRVPVAGQG